MEQELDTLIERLTQRIDLERIYQFSFPDDEDRPKQTTQLLLVVNTVKGMAPNALAPIVSLCMSDLDEEIPFEMIITGEWSNKVKQGSLYYSYASLPDHLRYANNQKPNALFSNKNINGLLELAQHNYDKTRAISDEFRAGVDNFLVKDDYTQATYMLHQFVETRLKAFKSSVLGARANKVHNLEQLFKGVQGSLPSLQDIFSYDEEQRELLRKLDQSYTKTLKWQQIDITKEEFEILLQKCEQATNEMDKYVSLMLTCIIDYRDKKVAEQAEVAATQNKETLEKKEAQATQTLVCEDFSGFPWLPNYKNDVNKLLDKIRKNHNPEQITMLNYHTGGFSGGGLFQQEQEENSGVKVELHLVVMMKNTGPFHFKCMQVGAASAMVLYLNLPYIENKLAEGNRFVNILWTKGRVLRRKSTFEPQFKSTPVDWKKELEEVEKCVDMTTHVIEEIQTSLKNNTVEPVVNYCVQRSMLEAFVITYLHCTIGYVPKDIPLRHLLDWTGVVSDQIIEFLCPKTDTECGQLYLLLRPEKLWMNGAFDELFAENFLKDEKTQSHLLVFQNLLERVLEQLKKLVKKELEVKA